MGRGGVVYIQSPRVPLNHRHGTAASVAALQDLSSEVDCWSMSQRVIETPRLRLRPWTTQDLPAFAAMNADPRVMEYMPKLLSRAETEAMVARIGGHFESHGWGLWAVEVVGVTPFVGFTGLSVPSFQAHFTPCVEIGWRLAYEHWGRGYATEAAAAALAFGFGELGLDQVVSFTAKDNVRSRRVMERLGMTYSMADDFEHPNLAQGHRLRPHVLYRLSRGAAE